MSDAIFRVEEVANKRAAHFLDIIHNIGLLIKCTIVVPNPVNLFDTGETVAGTGKDVDFVAPALERSRQFGYVRRHTSHRIGVESFPRKHCDAHI
jgi:hypothetical protein